jgi:hypothetical protein
MSFNTTLRPAAASVAIGALLTAIILICAAAAAGSGGVGIGGGGGGGGSDARHGNRNATPPKYQRLWDRVKRHDRRWAARVAECESGKDANAVALNGRYRGAFMFTRDAWKTSPKTPGGDPIDYSYRTQAVVAVHLKKRDGTRPWPVCG